MYSTYTYVATLQSLTVTVFMIIQVAKVVYK